MSRLTKKPIILPEGVTFRQEGAICTIQGPKGALTIPLLAGVRVQCAGTAVSFECGEGRSASCGTAWAHTRNAVEGVTRGFTKILEIEGVGFKAALEGKTLVLQLGFVNPVRIPVPEGIALAVEKGTIKISGADKTLVGEVSARIRALKPPEPYKGKGIRYQGEIIRRKAGKKAAAAAGAAA
ncbi:MAG: 50S ribosomal protein L6 [Candidatus Liptonbacteria bacterium]|nr:50S ribosomal protein L6 [Candidatus Liptonbacteria bacterium]